MQPIADTPRPPYYAVIFTSIKTGDDAGYSLYAQRMLELAASQPGFLGVESAHAEVGITVSYWSDPEAIARWRGNIEHRQAQRLGQDRWYAAYKIRICKVERESGMGSSV